MMSRSNSAKVVAKTSNAIFMNQNIFADIWWKMLLNFLTTFLMSTIERNEEEEPKRIGSRWTFRN